MGAARNLIQEFEKLQHITVKQVAEKLQIHHRTVRKLIASGKLKSVKIGGKRLVLLTEFLNYYKTHAE